MKTLSRIALIGIFLVPTISSAAIVGGLDSSGGWFLGFGSGGGLGAGCGSTICFVANEVLYIINYVLVPVIFAIAFLVFLYGIAHAYILSNGEPEAVKEGHRLLLWGVVGFAVMVSLWGLVNIVANTFGLAGYTHPLYPTSI